MNPDLMHDDWSKRIAITGAAGSLASDVIPGLVGLGYEIVGIDQSDAVNNLCSEWVTCSVTDRSWLLPAFTRCSAVVHLAGIPLETDWDRLLRANIDGTQSVLETARLQGIKRVVLASSIHAAGFTAVPDGDDMVPDTVVARPNTFYGVTKAAVEALGSMYHDRYEMDVICLRIASRCATPENERMLSTWLSPADAVRLIDASLTTQSPGFRTVWGASANSRGYLSTLGGEGIGFTPRDNAEDHAAELAEATAQNPSLLASEWDQHFIGGVFSSPNPPQYAR
jgi:uronate dehydrogenase